jgi:hypothetical protein
VFEVTGFDITVFDVTVFDVTVFGVTALGVTAFGVTVRDFTAPGLSVTARSPSEASESPAAAFAIHGILTPNPLAALPPLRRTLEARSEGNDGDSSVARSRERARDGVSLAASAM